MAGTTHTEWRRGQLHEQRDPFHSFCSIRRPYIIFKLPRGDMDTPPQFLPISGDRDVSLSLSLEWPVWSSSSGNNCHAVHRSLSSGASLWSGTFTLSHIISRAHLRDFFRLLAIGKCHFRYLWNGRWDRHRAEITIRQFIGHSLPVHHFFYGTVRIFTLSHIVSQAVFYTVIPKPMECKLSRWLLLVLETWCGGCRAQEEVIEKTFHPRIISFMYFSLYYRLP